MVLISHKKLNHELSEIIFVMNCPFFFVVFESALQDFQVYIWHWKKNLNKMYLRRSTNFLKNSDYFEGSFEIWLLREKPSIRIEKVGFFSSELVKEVLLEEQCKKETLTGCLGGSDS